RTAWTIPISFTRSRRSPTGFSPRFAISFLSPAPAKLLTRPSGYMSALARLISSPCSKPTTGHGYTYARRMAGYAWFGRWLAGEEDHRPEPKIEIASAQELACTPTGQVVNLPDAETVFSLNRKRVEQIRRPQLSPDQLRS